MIQVSQLLGIPFNTDISYFAELWLKLAHILPEYMIIRVNEWMPLFLSFHYY